MNRDASRAAGPGATAEVFEASALEGFVESGGNWEVAAFPALIASTLEAIGCS